jgi:hypothetical protein
MATETALLTFRGMRNSIEAACHGSWIRGTFHDLDDRPALTLEMDKHVPGRRHPCARGDACPRLKCGLGGCRFVVHRIDGL